jgi:hypothetical protein
MTAITENILEETTLEWYAELVLEQAEVLCKELAEADS